MARTGNPAVRQVEAVQRAIAVLDVLGEAGGELGTNEIARRTGINVSSVSRLLATLAEGGLAQHIPATGRYRLGIRILQLARTVRESLDIRDIARPYLVELSELTGETATLSLPGQHEVLTIDFVQSEASVRSVAAIGRNSVAHATAAGKVFLAWGGKLPGAGLVAFTDKTVTDPAELDREVGQVRERGWASAAGEREPQLNGVAVPILDSGRLIAILGIQGPAARFSSKPMRRAVDLLAERAALIESVVQGP